jgi:hypothetical protein
MAKIALLIGISEYGEGLPALPGTQIDVEAMQRVLRDPQIGEFDSVELLRNPDLQAMQVEIETLFSDRSQDDLLVLYFSGHGVRADDGTLYLASRSTQKNRQGRILTSTAVPASFVQSCMGNSRSKRQVLILDCCFSGAFANDLRAKALEVVVDIGPQLGGEGRAVLTSSTETQVSLEDQGGGIYTRYLVQGLETGAANRDNDDYISVAELHEYAKEHVQKTAARMKPEIYIVREGYNILLAKAPKPKDDPELLYRQALEERAKQKRGKLSVIDQRALEFRRKELGLSAEVIKQIAAEVLQPYEVFWAKIQEFEAAIEEALAEDPQMSPATLDDLRYLMRVLQLQDEDAETIATKFGINLKQPTPEQKPEPPVPVQQEPPEPQPPDESAETSTSLSENDWDWDDFSFFDDDIDYTRLRDLLETGDWKAAQQATFCIMLRTVGKNNLSSFTEEELLNFPCDDLRTIDQLWVRYSNGHFGFSVQKRLYATCGGYKPNDNYPIDPIDGVWYQFCDLIGWRVNYQWIKPSSVTFDTTAPQGHLPWWGNVDWGYATDGGQLLSCLFSRMEACRV